MQGSIKWFNPRKGYGFIQGDDGKEIFVHHTAVPMDANLSDGDKVEYQVGESERGPRATDVKKL
jgi:CspA family cold shock protein